MARLFSLMNAGAIDDPEHGHIEPGEHGGFDLTDELSGRLLAMHVKGKPMWEDEIGRQNRVSGEETARRRDPQTLYDAVEQIAQLAAQLAAMQLASGGAAAPAAEPAKASRVRGRKAEGPAAADAGAGAPGTTANDGDDTTGGAK